jgi:23S rRNA (adenine2503-C2)-methyltransferase
MSSLKNYQRATGDRITIEYALFKNVNDSLSDARALVRLLHGLHSYVNLIPGNPNPGGYERSAPEDVLRFKSVLESAGFESEIRAERGGDINAACGQLRAKTKTPAGRSAPQTPR